MLPSSPTQYLRARVHKPTLSPLVATSTESPSVVWKGIAQDTLKTVSSLTLWGGEQDSTQLGGDPTKLAGPVKTKLVSVQNDSEGFQGEKIEDV